MISMFCMYWKQIKYPSLLAMLMTVGRMEGRTNGRTDDGLTVDGRTNNERTERQMDGWKIRLHNVPGRR